MARDRPSPYVKRRRFFHRSAGACPPRLLDCACGMARDRPSPYDEGGLSAAAPQGGTPPVGQDRLILTRSGAGAPELQRWAQYLPNANHIKTGRKNRDQEVSPTGRLQQDLDGRNRDQEVSPMGDIAPIETGRSLLPGKSRYETPSGYI